MKKVGAAVANHSMLKFDKKDHFEKLELEPNFDLNLNDLEAKYLHFQQIFHPDKLVNKSKEEQIDLEHNSFLLNEAYEILKNPLKRAIYLLKLQGIDIDSDNCHVKPNHKILTEILELRELIFETENKDELNKIRNSCQMEINNILEIAKKEFLTKNYFYCAEWLIKAKYLDKSLLEIKTKLKK